MYAMLGDKDRAFAELEESLAASDWDINRLKVDPFLDPLRGDVASMPPETPRPARLRSRRWQTILAPNTTLSHYREVSGAGHEARSRSHFDNVAAEVALNRDRMKRVE